ncbi:MAG: T9SS type A sorting domain-containing protein [Saprospiraceae bacterium]|nr:T9SS type A sorting domain-containing protein [Saprospiraceae bacterium]
MKSISLLLIALLFAGISASAQNRSVVAAAGGEGQTANVRLNWTLGEPAVATLQRTNGELLTEGFQQPEILRIETAHPPVVAASDGLERIRIAPNPVSAVLTVRMPDAWTQESSSLELFDLGGRRVQSGRIETGTASLEWDMSALPAGTYWLRIAGTAKQAQTFKVVKIQ